VAPALWDPDWARTGPAILCDQGCSSRFLGDHVVSLGVRSIRPDRKDKPCRLRPLAPVRPGIESIRRTLKGQRSLERSGGRIPGGVLAWIAQRLLALVAGIWWNWRVDAQDEHSLVAYAH